MEEYVARQMRIMAKLSMLMARRGGTCSVAQFVWSYTDCPPGGSVHPADFSDEEFERRLDNYIRENRIFG